MHASSFLFLFEKFESLVQRLPGAIQEPVLREITPIKTLFLLQRAPRLVLVGEHAAAKSELLNSLCGREMLPAGEESLRDGSWQSVMVNGSGSLRVLDARRPVSSSAAEMALKAEPADVFIFVQSAGSPDAADLEHAARLVEYSQQVHPGPLRVLGLHFKDDENAREALHAALHAIPVIESRLIGTAALLGTEEGNTRLVELLAMELPAEAQLEMARFSSNRTLQAQIAKVLIKSMTAISAAVGAQPIPFADFPILMSLQSAMVTGIMHISGRTVSARLAAEFMGALGASVGAGLALRQGARAAVKMVPFWGNAVSGAVAAAGTFSMGRAAAAYFIEGVSMEETRAFFKRRKKPALVAPTSKSVG